MQKLLNTSPLAPKRAAIYCRVSSTAQEENSSLGTQEAACIAFANEQGFDVVAVYREVHTGIELFERPELAKLRELVRAKRVDVVVAYALDRLARDPVHVGVILSEAEHHHIAVHFVTEPLDDSPEGQLIRFVRGYAAKVEHLKIVERTTRGKKARAAAGKLIPASKPMYGYRWKDETRSSYVIDTNTAPIVQRMYREITQGKTLRQIAGDLSKDGVAPPKQRSSFWHASTIVAMLHRPAYMGDAYAWGWTRLDNGRQVFDPSKAIRLPDGTIPPLIDPAVWEAAQSILKRNKATATRSAKNPEAGLLRGGYVRCGHCGWTMRVRPLSQRGGYEYVCVRPKTQPGVCIGPSIRTHLLDSHIWSIVTQIIQDPSVVQYEVERLRQDDPTVHDLQAIDRSLDQIHQQQSKLSRAIALLEDEDALAPVVAHLQELAERKRQLESERERVLRRRAGWTELQASYVDLEQWCQRVAERLNELSYKEKRMIFDVLGLRIEVFGNGHDPRYVITADIDPNLVSSTSRSCCVAPRSWQLPTARVRS
jgi:site-specific DNA recombinase